MSYKTQAILARDNTILERIAACAATQGARNPENWVWGLQWVWSAQPGWDAAYAYAVGSGITSPGADESVITDNMILSAVQSMKSKYPPAA